MQENKWSVFQGIVSHNPVFAAGMAIAPAIIIGSTLAGAIAYAAVFSAVTLLTLLIASFVPKKVPYALRIILYTLTAAAVYILCYIYVDSRIEYDLSKLGVFLPMIVTGEFIVSAAEIRFFRLSKEKMVMDVISHIIGYDIAIIFLGAFRELFGTGGIGGELYGISHTVPLLTAPCGGFILIGLIGAFIRICTRRR